MVFVTHVRNTRARARVNISHVKKAPSNSNFESQFTLWYLEVRLVSDQSLNNGIGWFRPRDFFLALTLPLRKAALLST